MRPPPNDPVFIILVALLTTILSVPILILLNYLLNGYASNYPGSRSLDDEIGKEDEIDGTNPSKKSSTSNITAAEILRNSMSSSAFGAKLRKGLPAGDTVDYRSINITSQNSYAGKREQSFDHKSFLVDTSSVDSSEGYGGSLPCPSRIINCLPRQLQHCQKRDRANICIHYSIKF